MNSNWVNLIKLCVGIETVDELKARQISFDEKNKTKLKNRTHVTRMWPKRGE